MKTTVLGSLHHDNLHMVQRSEERLAELIVGTDMQVPVIDGHLRRYTNLDNAASTPPARRVVKTVETLMGFYAAVHRGSGFKSQVSSFAYEEARRIIAKFAGADTTDHCVVFTRNTTEGINKLVHRLRLTNDDVIVVSQMEHHSSLLPFRTSGAQVEIAPVDKSGAPILNALQAMLNAHGRRVKLVAISGGSNVTGHISDIHAIAEIAHEAGASVLVDGAQLAPHRPINMGKVGDKQSLDFLAFSAHKMYAPYGTGVLIGPRSLFEHGVPQMVGGGAVEFVSEQDVIWAEPPDNEEAGSPNVVGAVAMAAATLFITEDIGWDILVQHERDLTSYALEKLNKLPGMTIYGDPNPSLLRDRLGVISFNLRETNHQLVAAILSHEYAIGTRTVAFCAHPLLMRLANLSPAATERLKKEIEAGDRRRMVGAIRVSLGCYNTREDVDKLIEALQDILQERWIGTYSQNVKSGEYQPIEAKQNLSAWFKW